MENKRFGKSGMGWMGLVTGVILFGATACTGDFHSNTNRREMRCDATGCWHCDDGTCEEYRCDETHQCPMKTVCSIDRRCMPGDDQTPAPGPGCTSHDQCDAGEICTLQGTCVTSPGDPNRPDVSGGDTSTGGDDTSTGGDDTSTGGDDTSSGGDDASGSGDDGTTTDPDTTLPQHPDDVCLSNADCGFDGTCINGSCFFGCRADGSCPPGQECTADGCRTREVAENACTFNGECGANHVCRDGTCFRRCDETTQCRSAERCSGGLCVADTLPVIQCSGAASCENGKACVDGKCVVPCNAAGSCNSANQSCDLGYCMPDPTCFDASDCGGADCVDGVCSSN
jgi:hypothetical protein